MIEIDRETIETDVLVVGGGIAGLMAAIGAAEEGVSVVVAEKANTKRSGCGATGNDHFLCYCPPYHGDDMTPVLEEWSHHQIAGFQDTSHITKFLEQSFNRVQNWHAWGIDMKPHGTWEFTGHAFPERPRLFLKYAGHNQKGVLTKEAKKRGVKLENHLPISDLITNNGEVIGAIGLSVKKEKPVVKIIRAKAVIQASGSGNRLYPAPASPGWMFNIAQCPTCTGNAQATAYRAGARLVNMEFPARHAGPKFLNRCGKATWIGLVTDSQGKPVGPFVTKADREIGDITTDVWPEIFTDMARSGKGPAYMDCSATSDDDLEYMKWGLVNEGNTSLLNYMEQEGIDFRKNRFEFMRYEPFLVGRGVEIDLNGETNIKGLYAAGDPVGNFRADIAGAATFGWIASKSAAARSKSISSFQQAEKSPIIEERVGLYAQFMDREGGPCWKEANLAIQQIMRDYVGPDVRSETLLKAGRKYLGDLREKVLTTMAADNSHTLMRCLEVLDLLECGEVIFLAALERKETRAMHKRTDFPFTNPLLADKFLTICQEKGQPKLEWRDKN